MDNRDMRVNVNITKDIISGEWQKVMQKALRWPCGVCGRGTHTPHTHSAILQLYGFCPRQPR